MRQGHRSRTVRRLAALEQSCYGAGSNTLEKTLLQKGVLDKDRSASRGAQLYPVAGVHGVDRSNGPEARIRPLVTGNIVQGQVQQQLAPEETPLTAAPTPGSEAPACWGAQWLYRSTGKPEDIFRVTVGGGLPQHLAGNHVPQKPDF